MTRLSLETGDSALFAAANRLYQREGFERCGPFGGYRAERFHLLLHARNLIARPTSRLASREPPC